MNKVFVRYVVMVWMLMMSGVAIAAEYVKLPAANEQALSAGSEVFTNKYLLSLKKGVTPAQIKAIKDPFLKKLATQHYLKKYQKKGRGLVIEPYEPVYELSKRLKTSGYSQYENPTGIYFEQDEEVVVIMDDPKGKKLFFVICNFGEGGGRCFFPLKAGVNIFKSKNKGLGYVEYFTTDYKTAPKLKMSVLTGQVNGVFRTGKTKPAEWKKMLNDSPSDVIDIVGNRVHLIYAVKELKEVCGENAQKLIDIYDHIIGWQQEIMGLKKYKMMPKNRMLGRAIWRGFMHADGIGAAFHHNTLKDLADPNKVGKQSWGIAHEFGHVNQVRPSMKWVSTSEVTNNIYSAHANYMLNPANMRLEHEVINGGDGRMRGGRFNAFLNSAIVKGDRWLTQKGPDSRPVKDRPPVADHFVKLTPLWQLMLYYQIAGQGNKDFYPYIFHKAIMRDDRGKPDGYHQIEFMKNACDAAKEDLSDFFEKVGMLKPIDEYLDDYSCAQLTITEHDCNVVRQYAKKYPKPASPVIYYISANSVEAYKKRLPVQGTPNTGVLDLGNGSVKVMHDVWKNVTVFETYKEDELVRVTMVGTDSEDNSMTRVIYPAGSTRIEAVGWDGKRILVYGSR